MLYFDSEWWTAILCVTGLCGYLAISFVRLARRGRR